MNHRLSWRTGLSLLALGVAAAALLSLTVGAAGIPLEKLFRAIASAQASMERTILLRIRLPRVVLALGAGGALSLAGVILQGLFRNPLVEPYTLGVSGGSALGVALAIVLGLHRTASYVLPVAGFAGALAVMLLVSGLGASRRLRGVESMLLMGVMISFIASSLFMLLMALSKAEDLHGIVYWTLGSLDEPDRLLVFLLLGVSLAGLIYAWGFSSRLNAMALGQEDAHHLGVDVARTRQRLFLAASLLTGVAVAVTGIIGFVGLVVPHFVRRILGGDHRVVLPAAYLAGGLFLLLSDTAARVVIAPLELPIGVVTGLVGGGLFVEEDNVDIRANIRPLFRRLSVDGKHPVGSTVKLAE